MKHNLKESCLEHSNFERQWPSDAQNCVQSAPTYTSHRSSRRFCGSRKDAAKYSCYPENRTEAGSCVQAKHGARKLLNGAHTQA